MFLIQYYMIFERSSIPPSQEENPDSNGVTLPYMIVAQLLRGDKKTYSLMQNVYRAAEEFTRPIRFVRFVPKLERPYQLLR